MQGESTLPCGVGPDEPKAKSASVRGFESPLPHHSRTSRILSTGIIEYGFWMRKEGYSETTIERYVRLLRRISDYGDLPLQISFSSRSVTRSVQLR